MDVQPYQFEPLARDRVVPDVESEGEDVGNGENSRRTDTTW